VAADGGGRSAVAENHFGNRAAFGILNLDRSHPFDLIRNGGAVQENGQYHDSAQQENH
jgi:hypothetical protein